MIARIRFRRGTAALWASVNPILGVGEPGWETDTDKLKIGDGVTAWNDLSYFAAGGGGSDETVGETPMGAINDSNQDYTTAANYTKLKVFKNGVRAVLTTDYIETGANSFQMVSAPLTGDSLLVDYVPA